MPCRVPVIARCIACCIAALVLTNSADFASAGGVVWKTNLKQAAREAQQTKKPMLLEFTAPWCKWCKHMNATTFADRQVVERINRCFVPISVDYERNAELVKAVGVKMLPTTVIISSNLDVLKTISGFHSAREFQAQLGSLCPDAKTAQARRTAISARPVSSRRVKQAAPAFGAYCLVSMKDDQKLRAGQLRFAVAHRGRTIVFNSEEYKKRFLLNPDVYWPMNDGHCPVTQRNAATRHAGQPKLPVIYRQRLWFFANADARQSFSANPRQYVPVGK